MQWHVAPCLWVLQPESCGGDDLRAVAGLPPVAWGEDDTLVIRPREAIDIEFRNPLYGVKMPELWQTPPK